jgi:hypothetical protein
VRTLPEPPASETALALERPRLASLPRPGVDAVAAPALVAAILGLYALLRAPVLDPGGYLDPWIYTASFVNFDFIYSTFGWAYYPSRLPWVIPGILAHRLLPPLGAFFLLHVVFFAAGGLFAFLLVRRFLGRPAAYVAAAALMLSTLYYDAYSNDYPDGGLVTYLLGAAYFGFGAVGARRRSLRLVGAGFCVGAAAGINLVSLFVVLAMALGYVVFMRVEPGFWRRLAADAAAAAGGILLLLLTCGGFSVAHGGEFLFFMPQWRFARSASLSHWKLDGYDWLLNEPQLLLPVFLLLGLGILLAQTRLRGWRDDAGLRFAAASGVFLAGVTAVAWTWEFAFGGNWLELTYYYSMFTVPFALVLAAILHLLARRAGLRGSGRLAAALVAAAAPVVIVYEYGLSPLGHAASLLALVLMIAAVAAVAVSAFSRRTAPRGGTVAVVAVVSVLFAANYAAAAGRITHSVFVPGSSEFESRRATLSMAMQLIDFMRDHGLQESAPAFWYDNRGGSELNGIQSTYLWGITAIGFDMPRFDASERQLLEARRPLYVVLLCRTASCDGGAAALERAGYALRPKARTQIAAGGRRYWVVAYRLPKFKVLDAAATFYQPGQSPFAAAPTGKAVSSASFAHGLPEGWSGSASIVPGATTRVTTKPRRWEYSVVSPKQSLEPGTYRVYLSGKVVAGGLDLGVLDVGANKWIAQRFYWFRQRGFAGAWMSTPFRLDASTQVEVVLSNWVPQDQSSTWELRELRLVRLR